MITTFNPPERILMGPGPSDISSRVLQALSRPTIGHLDPAFITMMDEIKVLLQFAFQTSNELTLPVSAPGSAGMETVFVNLLEPGDKVVVCQNGVFGGRMLENVNRCGGEAILVEDDWGKPVDPEKVREVLKQNTNIKAIAFVHAETSTGARSDVETLCQLAADYGCLSIVDSVTGLGGIELDVDGWGIDAIYSGTQKCLSCVPGISPVSFSPRAAEVIAKRATKVQSWFLDLNLVMGYWGGESKRSYHHTAPVNDLYALHEALLILQEEGLQSSWQRHALHHQAFVAGIQAVELDIAVQPEFRLPQLNAVTIPEGVDEARIRRMLLEGWGIEIGAGLGTLAGKVWRVGLMGHSACQRNVLVCLAALESALASEKGMASGGVAVSAAQQVYSSSGA